MLGIKSHTIWSARMPFNLVLANQQACPSSEAVVDGHQLGWESSRSRRMAEEDTGRGLRNSKVTMKSCVSASTLLIYGNPLAIACETPK